MAGAAPPRQGATTRSTSRRSHPAFQLSAAIQERLRLLHAFAPFLRSIAVISSALLVPIAAHRGLRRTHIVILRVITAAISTAISTAAATIVAGLWLVHASLPIWSLVAVEPGALLCPNIARCR